MQVEKKMDQLYNVWNSVQPLLPPPSSSRSLNQFSTPRFDTFTPLHPVNADLSAIGNASSSILPSPSTLQQPNQSNKNPINMNAQQNNVTPASSGTSKVKEHSAPPGHVRRSRHECMICFKPFSNKYNLERHMPLHDEKQKLWKCKVCLRAYTTETIFHSHKRVHHKNEEPTTITFEIVYELRKGKVSFKKGNFSMTATFIQNFIFFMLHCIDVIKLICLCYLQRYNLENGAEN